MLIQCYNGNFRYSHDPGKSLNLTRIIIISCRHCFIMPRSTGRQRQAASASQKANEVQDEKRSILTSETAKNDLWNSLQAANLRISELEKLLEEKDLECHRLQSALDNCNQKLQKHHDSSALWKEKHEKTYHELHMQSQTTKRGKEKLTRLEEQLEVLKTAKEEASKQFLCGSSESHQAILSLKNENISLHNELSASVAKWTSQLERAHAKLARSSLDLKTLHGKSEGYFSEQIQLGYEMENTRSMTFSADGTSHRSINYNSRHVHLVAEDYTSPENSSKE